MTLRVPPFAMDLSISYSSPAKPHTMIGTWLPSSSSATTASTQSHRPEATGAVGKKNVLQDRWQTRLYNLGMAGLVLALGGAGDIAWARKQLI